MDKETTDDITILIQLFEDRSNDEKLFRISTSLIDKGILPEDMRKSIEDLKDWSRMRKKCDKIINHYEDLVHK